MVETSANAQLTGGNGRARLMYRIEKTNEIANPKQRDLLARPLLNHS
jgi:hypothetical protein